MTMSGHQKSRCNREAGKESPKRSPLPDLAYGGVGFRIHEKDEGNHQNRYDCNDDRESEMYERMHIINSVVR